MGLLDRFRRKAKTIAPVAPLPEPPRETTAPAEGRRSEISTSELIAMISGGLTGSGVRVTPESALTFSAVLACVRVLAEGVAALPLITYERSGRGKEPAYTHPLYTVLHDSPNDEMTSFQWRETSMVHDALWGNCYSEIISDGAGRVRELWPLLPIYMTPKRMAGALVYEYRDPMAGLITYSADSILHVAGLSMDGLMGMTMIGIQRETIGLGMTLNRHGARMFANGARAGGVLENPGSLTDQAYNRLKTSFDASYAGVENAGKTVLLEEGTKFNPLTMPNDDAQFLQSRMFQIEEVARMFRVPPHMIGDLEHATFSNIEQQSLDFVIYSLTPWLVRWEQAFSHRLLLPRERAQYFSKFKTAGLLRGDIQSRYNAYQSSINTGWMTRNEVRELEDLNPDDPELDRYLQPLNMTTTGSAPAAPKGSSHASL